MSVDIAEVKAFTRRLVAIDGRLDRGEPVDDAELAELAARRDALLADIDEADRG